MNWNGLQSGNTLLKYSCQYERNKGTYQEKSTGKTKGKEAVPVRICQEMMNHLKGLPCGDCFWEGEKIGLRYGTISI